MRPARVSPAACSLLPPESPAPGHASHNALLCHGPCARQRGSCGSGCRWRAPGHNRCCAMPAYPRNATRPASDGTEKRSAWRFRHATPPRPVCPSPLTKLRSVIGRFRVSGIALEESSGDTKATGGVSRRFWRGCDRVSDQLKRGGRAGVFREGPGAQAHSPLMVEDQSGGKGGVLSSSVNVVAWHRIAEWNPSRFIICVCAVNPPPHT